MSEWQYQIRIYLNDRLAQAARARDDSSLLKSLRDLLAQHSATMKSQYDAFADYVTEAEKNGTGAYPLYEWTKATIENPVKREKYSKAFTIYAGGQEVYAKEIADAIEESLRPLVTAGLIAQLSKHDTNPANNPQPPARYRGAE